MRLNGGEFLLDFTALSLTDSASSVTISNKEILSALTELKIYINNQKSIKPVWVKFIDDDTDEIIVARGEIRKAIGDLEFDLFISSKGHSLSIHVEFTQMVDGDSNPLDDYYIASGDASYVYTSAQPIFEEIVDKDGHERFLEGTITTPEITGVTQTYGKWSLSGSHLLIVLGLHAENGSELVSWNSVGSLTDLPKWIFDKIVPIFAGNIVDQKTFSFFDSVGTTQNFTSRLTKSATTISIITQSLTLTAERNCRISYDLLIDNE